MATTRGSKATTTKIDRRLNEILDGFDITAQKMIQDFAADVLESLIELSPLGPYENGRIYPLPTNYIPGKFITNWQVAIGNKNNIELPPAGPSAKEDAYVRGLDVIQRYSGSDAISFKGNTFRVGETITIFNNTPYREQVELDGWAEGWRMKDQPADGPTSTEPYEPVKEVEALLPALWETAKQRNS